MWGIEVRPKHMLNNHSERLVALGIHLVVLAVHATSHSVEAVDRLDQSCEIVSGRSRWVRRA